MLSAQKKWNGNNNGLRSPPLYAARSIQGLYYSSTWRLKVWSDDINHFAREQRKQSKGCSTLFVLICRTPADRERVGVALQQPDKLRKYIKLSELSLLPSFYAMIIVNHTWLECIKVFIEKCTITYIYSPSVGYIAHRKEISTFETSRIWRAI